jgi:hypothetical protein
MIKPRIDYAGRTGTFHCSICNHPIVTVHESEVDLMGPQRIREMGAKFTSHFVEKHPDDLDYMMIELGGKENQDGGT